MILKDVFCEKPNNWGSFKGAPPGLLGQIETKKAGQGTPELREVGLYRYRICELQQIVIELEGGTPTVCGVSTQLVIERGTRRLLV